jgi:hypothetical protein
VLQKKTDLIPAGPVMNYAHFSQVGILILISPVWCAKTESGFGRSIVELSTQAALPTLRFLIWVGSGFV